MNNESKTYRKRWKPEEIMYLKNNFGRRSLKGLSQATGRSVASIMIAAHTLGLAENRARRCDYE